VAQIYCEIFGLPRAEVLYYVLHHDDGELYGGDVPAPVKRDVPAMKAASDEAEVIGIGKLGVVMPELMQTEWQCFKICDFLEIWEYACSELHMGNRFAWPIITTYRRMTLERAVLLEVGDHKKRVLKWIKREETRWARRDAIRTSKASSSH